MNQATSWMQRFAVLISAAAFMFAISGCGSSTADSKTDSANGKSAKTGEADKTNTKTDSKTDTDDSDINIETPGFNLELDTSEGESGDGGSIDIKADDDGAKVQFDPDESQ